jgi:hypothetical protein
MIGGAHMSAWRGEGQRQLSVGAPSCSGDGNWVGHRRSTQAYLAGRGRRQPGKVWASAVARAGWAEIRRKNLFKIKIGFLNLPCLWKFVQENLG